ncbi:hypothetical protein DWC97_24305, partial [Salmonella enterica]|nr:hypothetical protein [Salmonella enterica]EBM2290906.1 hypothetical protein [Salmonella enterica]
IPVKPVNPLKLRMFVLIDYPIDACHIGGKTLYIMLILCKGLRIFMNGDHPITSNSGKTLLRLDEQGTEWLNPRQLQASSTPKYLGPGSLSRKLYARCEGHSYLQKNSPKYRKDKRSRGRQAPPPKMAHDNRSSAKEPWLIFSNINDITPRSIMKLYSRRMQIEQNFSYPRPLSTHVPGAVLKSLVLLN